MKKCNEIWKRGEKIVKCIGFDFDEWHRIREFESAKYENYYPLVDWCWNRQKCVDKLKEYNFTASKSSCFFCPAMKKYEVLNLKNNFPEYYERALAIESNAELTTNKGLGRSWSWKELGKADDNQLKLFDEDSYDIGCGCTSG